MTNEQSSQTALEKDFHDLQFDVDVSMRYHARFHKFFSSAYYSMLAAVVLYLMILVAVSSLSSNNLGLFFISVIAVLSAFVLSWKLSARSEKHENLRIRFIVLMQQMMTYNEKITREKLNSWKSEKLEIELNETKPNRTVHAICYNEVVKSLTDVPEDEKQFVDIRLRHRMFGWLGVFDDSLKLGLMQKSRPL